MADPSIVVEGDSLEAAIEEGARRLGVTRREVRHWVLEEGRRGLLGLGARPWRVRVEKRDLLTPRLEEALRIAADIDGSFEVSHEGRNVYLLVRPPIGSGRPADPAEIAQALRELETEGWTIDDVKAAVARATARPERIGQFRFAGEIDSYLKVQVEEGRMRAYATIVPPRRGGRDMDLDGALKGLAKAGVTHGVRREEVALALERKFYNEPILAAEGTPPRHGLDGRVEFYVRTDRHRAYFVEDAHGRVDWRETGFIENVVEGQPLARLVPPTDGEDGRDVTGMRLPARPGKPARLPAGTNVVVDGDVVRAAVTGHVSMVAGRLRVDPIFQVAGDIDMTVGNIRFQGTVEVGGAVEDGFVVEATGSVLVRKSVGKARIRAGGNIVVLGGIAGKDEAEIEAEGDVVAKYIERANVRAGRDVVVGEAILHSEITAGEEVVVETGRGAIIGGSVTALRRVSAKVIGGEAAARATVRVGVDPDVLRRIEALHEEIRREEARLGPVEEALRLVACRDVPPDIAAKRKDLEAARDRIRGVAAERRERLRALEASLEVLDPPPVVKVADRAYAGTRIEIGRAFVVLQEPARYIHCSFRRVGGEVQVGPF